MLFSEEAQKAAQFIQLANQIDTPLLFLQNVTGYMVGKRYEQGGIIKHGSLMVNAVSNSAVPHLTLQVGGSYGAGNYGMSGRAYKPRFLFLWPNAKTAVMGPEQLAGTLSIVARQAAAAAGKPFDEEADAQRRAAIEEQIERESLVAFTSGRLLDDGILDPRDSRTALGLALSAVPLERGRAARASSACSGCDARAMQQAPDREPGRDRAAHPAHLPRAGHRAPSPSTRSPTGDAPFVREADEAVALGGATPGGVVPAHRRRSSRRRARRGADAVHPGLRLPVGERGLRRGLRARRGCCSSGRRPRRSRRWAAKLEAKRRMQRGGRAAAAEPRDLGGARAGRAGRRSPRSSASRCS